MDDDVQYRLEVVGKKDVAIQDHMKSRVVGSIEVAYGMLGMHNHEASRQVTWVPMNLPQDEHRAVRRDIQDPNIPSTTREIFKKTIVQRYEEREGPIEVQQLLLPDFVSYYYICSTKKEQDKYRAKAVEYFDQPEYGKALPMAIKSGEQVYRLLQNRRRLWRTRLVNVMSDSELFYYQQILTHKAVYNMSFEEFKVSLLGEYSSWKDLYRFLVDRGIIEGLEVFEDSLFSTFNVSGSALSESQQQIFDSIVYKTTHLSDNAHWIMGGAGTGKSFLLAKFSQHFNELGYHVERLAPTGVASYNVYGQTVDRFFGLTPQNQEINKMKMNDHVKLYKKTLLLIDEFSMLTRATMEAISSALIQATGRRRAFGGVAVILFGDVAQLLPPKSRDYIWKSNLFVRLEKYTLLQSMRQEGDVGFQGILDLVRKCMVSDDMRVVNFIKTRVIDYQSVPIDCVRLYTRNKSAREANRVAVDSLPGELITYASIDYPAGSKVAVAALNFETHLVEKLYVKVGAIVMLIRNMDVERGWSNGSLARVVALSEDRMQLQHLENKTVKNVYRVQQSVAGTYYTRRQFPVSLAYALTIHKVNNVDRE